MARSLDKLLKTGTMMVVAIGCAATGESSSAQIPCSYEVAAIIQAPQCGDLDSFTAATAISPNGRWVCGYHFCPGGSNRSFVYDMVSGVFHSIPMLVGTSTSTAWDVNDAGVVVGRISDDAFVYDAVTNQYLQFLDSDSPGGVCEATGINNANVICGTRSIDDGGDPVEPRSAFI